VSTVDVGGRALHYARRGSGEPVLLIMGVAATVAYWGEPFLEALSADGFDVIAYDQRGIGGSARDREPFGVPELAGDAAGLLGALGVDSAHVVGFSLGGMVAQELALAHPTAVRRLVLVGTAPGGSGDDALDPGTLARLNEAIVSGDPARALRAGLEANVSPASAARTEVLQRWEQLVSQQKIPLPTVNAQLEAAARHDAADRLGEVAAPALVLHGAEDRMIRPLHAERLARSLPNARLEVMPDAGHLLPWEHPGPTARLVAAWLRGEPFPPATTAEETDVSQTN
jgi:3-oxoadipate enol-lactonase